MPFPDSTSLFVLYALLQLSGRLFPVPGKAAGDMTEFDSPFLINTEVFSMP